MTLDAANEVVRLMTAKIQGDANVIFGARQDPGFGETIKVMAIFTGVGGEEIRKPKVEPNQLAEALRLTPKQAPAASRNAPTVGQRHDDEPVQDFRRFD